MAVSTNSAGSRELTMHEQVKEVALGFIIAEVGERLPGMEQQAERFAAALAPILEEADAISRASAYRHAASFFRDMSTEKVLRRVAIDALDDLAAQQSAKAAVPHRCGCPTGLGYRYHRMPCSRSGEVEDLYAAAVECASCTEKHPDAGCADVGCTHNCEAAITAATTAARRSQ